MSELDEKNVIRPAAVIKGNASGLVFWGDRYGRDRHLRPPGEARERKIHSKCNSAYDLYADINGKP
jgi:hypothetical protein